MPLIIIAYLMDYSCSIFNSSPGFSWKLLIGIVVFRFFNALMVQTYYAPDEYWQGPEIAHDMIYGYGYR